MINWISVKDRLPENECDILIWTPYGHWNATGGHYKPDRKAFYEHDSVLIEDVTHWAEINEPEDK
jgi:hypothetical protein